MPDRPRLLSIALLVAASAFLIACDPSPATPTPRASATPTPSASPSGAALPKLFPLPAGVVPPGGDITITAKTARTAEPGTAYPYTLGHCGVVSPIDFDGSLWDVLGAQDGQDGPATDEQTGELINAGSGTMTLVDPDTALFRTKSRLILGLKRHEGAKAYQGCA